MFYNLGAIETGRYGPPEQVNSIFLQHYLPETIDWNSAVVFNIRFRVAMSV